MKPCEHHSPRDRPSSHTLNRHLRPMSFVALFALFEPDAVAIPDQKKPCIARCCLPTLALQSLTPVTRCRTIKSRYTPGVQTHPSYRLTSCSQGTTQFTDPSPRIPVQPTHFFYSADSQLSDTFALPWARAHRVWAVSWSHPIPSCALPRHAVECSD